MVVYLTKSTVECRGQLREFFVENSMTIDLLNLALRDSTDANGDNLIECHWKFTTSNDHILVFSSPNLERVEHFIRVRNYTKTATNRSLLLYSHSSFNYCRFKTA